MLLRFLMMLSWLAATALAVLAQPEEGGFSLEQTGDAVALDARGAPLFEILDGLEHLYDFRLNRGTLSNRMIRATFRPLPVDELLARLEISYVLYFSTAETPVPEDGYLFTSDLARAIFEQFPESVRTLIRNLYDDDISLNASRSLWALEGQVAEVLPLLEQTLQANDYQARQLALFLMQSGTTNSFTSPRFLDVAIEALADDAFVMLPSDNQVRHVFVRNAQASYHYLVKHPEVLNAAESRLVQGMYSADGQLRLLSAALLGGAQKTAHLPRIIQVMKPHLADNQLDCDARLVRNVLEVIGEPSIPYLEAIRKNPVDNQQAEQAGLILERIRTAGDYRETHNPYPMMNGWYPESFPRLEDLQ
ncbi:MAG: hypothetical protein H7A43_04995 [Verrucomicrobia bacterium]|nr:hypothetical protein [Verrucomicrobiota bacterium]